jgi:hypothetical protein
MLRLSCLPLPYPEFPTGGGLYGTKHRQYGPAIRQGLPSSKFLSELLDFSSHLLGVMYWMLPRLATTRDHELDRPTLT